MAMGTHKGLCWLLPVVGLVSVGCCAPQKAEITRLKARCVQLETDATQVRSLLSRAQQAQQALSRQLTAKEKELAAALQRIGEVQVAPEPGGEQAVYRTEIGSDILFASGKADLTAGGKQALDKVADEILAKHPGMIVRVYGHTDTDPIKKSKWKDNLELSAQRAMAVARHLARRKVPAAHLQATAMGQHHPVKVGGKVNKARSRRVEIVVLRR